MNSSNGEINKATEYKNENNLIDKDKLIKYIEDQLVSHRMRTHDFSLYNIDVGERQAMLKIINIIQNREYEKEELKIQY